MVSEVIGRTQYIVEATILGTVLSCKQRTWCGELKAESLVQKLVGFPTAGARPILCL